MRGLRNYLRSIVEFMPVSIIRKRCYTDLRKAYYNKSNELPQNLPKELFSKESIGHLEPNDVLFGAALMYLMHEKEILKNKYFIIDTGYIHSPLLTLLLSKMGISCHQCVEEPEMNLDSQRKALAYFSEKVLKTKCKSNRFASLFELHHGYDKESYTPSVIFLKKNDIKQVTLIIEQFAGELGRKYNDYEPFSGRIDQYKRWGIETRIFEIDPRGKEGKNKLQKFLKENSAIENIILNAIS